MSKERRRAENGRYLPDPVEGEVREDGIGQLVEARQKGHVLIDMITPGWGSSGYYSEEMLRRDMPKVYPAGTHMYIDHPTESEEDERPERSVSELAAVTTESARWDEKRGASVAEAVLFPDHAEALKAKAQAIGVSIRAHGEIGEGEAEGQSGPIIEALTEGISVDFVTKPGRGGRIGELLESARKEAEGTPLLAEVLDEVVAYEALLERDISRDERIALAKKGQAIPVRDSDGNITNGRFPMANCSDVSNAAGSIGRGSQPNEQLKSFIRRVASKLSCPTPFQSESDSDGQGKEYGMSDEDTQKRLSELEDQIRQQGEQMETLTQERDENKARADRAEDRALHVEAEGVVKEALADDGEDDDGNPVVIQLPDRAQQRAIEAALKDKLPLQEDGKLDRDKLVERAHKAAKDEHEYLHGAGDDKSPVREVTSRATVDNGGNGEDTEEALAGTFQELGLSEDAARVAARGR